MKRAIRIVLIGTLVLLVAALDASAQEKEGRKARYKDLKGRYSTEFYSGRPGDPYSPLLSGLTSFVIPGLGQCLEDEIGRGIGIMAANIGLTTLGIAEAGLMFYASGTEQDAPDKRTGNLLFIGSFAAALLTMGGQTALNIWNIFDAVRIAKVKNLYYRDTRLTAVPFDWRLEPSFGLSPSASTVQPTAGLSMKIRF